MKKYIEQNINDTMKMQSEAIAHYTKALREIKLGNHNQPIGIRATSFTNVVKEIYAVLHQATFPLDNIYGPSYHALAHLRMTLRPSTRTEAITEDADYYIWNLKHSRPFKISSIHHEFEDKRKYYYAILDSGKKFYLNDLGVTYRHYKQGEKEAIQQSKIKHVPGNFSQIIKAVEEETRKANSSPSYSEIIVKEIEHTTNNSVIPLFK